MRNEIIEELPLVTLVGPPNSGKTSLFNLLSGKNYKTVNYPGSTVEYSTCRFQKKYNIEADILDSPGIISLVPNSPDEKVSIDSLYSHPNLGSPHLIIAAVDASQLSRHLLLAAQLIESRFRIVIVLTMNDVLKKKNLEISSDLLSKRLNCDVIKLNGRTGEGLQTLIKIIEKNLNDINVTGKTSPVPYQSKNNKQELFASFNRIEQLAGEVLVEKASISKSKIEAANSELEIINNNGSTKNSPDKVTLQIDKILLHKVWGILIFILVNGMIFSSIFWLAAPLTNLVDELFSMLAQSASGFLGNNWFSALISDGIITGTGSVIVFIPQIIILFFILGILEDTGYLARGAMLIDKPLSKMGLNGRSFVPMLSGFACAIPAMLAARTIPNRRERMLTVFILPLMSCSARLPVYALLLAFLTPPDKPWIGGFALACIYPISMIISVVVASIIDKLRGKIIRAQDSSSFIIELPTYKIPTIRSLFRNTYSSTKQYLLRAGPVILTFSLILWALTNFPQSDNLSVQTNNEQQVGVSSNESQQLENSYAAYLGKAIQPVMEPVGFDWRVGVSLISAFVAREVFVSALALIFKVTDDEDNLQRALLNSMKNAKVKNTGNSLFTTSSIIGLIVFFIFALQCTSTLAVSRKETGSWRIPLLQLFIYSTLAYCMMFFTVHGLRFLGIN